MNLAPIDGTVPLSAAARNARSVRSDRGARQPPSTTNRRGRRIVFPNPPPSQTQTQTQTQTRNPAAPTPAPPRLKRRTLEHRERLLHLRAESLRGLDEVKHLGVVHLEKHAGDLRGGSRLDRVHERIERLAEEHPLLVRRRRRELRREQRHRVLGLAGRKRRRRHLAALVREAHALLASAAAAAAGAAASAAAALAGGAALRHRHDVLHVRSARAHRAPGNPGGHPGLEPVPGLRLRRAHHPGRRLPVVHRRAWRGHAVRAHVRHAARGDLPLRELRLQTQTAVLLALRERDVQRLLTRHLAVHLRHRTRRLIRGRERDERGAAAARGREGGGEEEERGGGVSRGIWEGESESDGDAVASGDFRLRRKKKRFAPRSRENCENNSRVGSRAERGDDASRTRAPAPAPRERTENTRDEMNPRRTSPPRCRA
eukprot:30773-Pelagococcus_subviridis.AAC.9